MSGSGVTRRRAVIGGLGAAIVAAPAAGAAPATPAAEDPMRVVLHVGEPGGWAPALSNLDNMTSLHPDGEFRLVADGLSVYMIAGPSDLYPKLETMASRGAAIMICPNALREHGIAPSQLPAYMDASEPGVVALARAQREGFAYVKP
ncbi:MAG: hypothetical protein ACKOWF_03985 [Chloroflexota bacterium]